MLQDKIARQAVIEEFKTSSGKWYEDGIERMLERFSELNIEGEEYSVLKKMNKYPHAILAGKTWSRIFSGLLSVKRVMSDISFFYRTQYEEFKSSLEGIELKTDKPIFVVIKSRILDENRVYPLKLQFPDGKAAIVLAINILN